MTSERAIPCVCLCYCLRCRCFHSVLRKKGCSAKDKAPAIPYVFSEKCTSNPPRLCSHVLTHSVLHRVSCVCVCVCACVCVRACVRVFVCLRVYEYIHVYINVFMCTSGCGAQDKARGVPDGRGLRARRLSRFSDLCWHRGGTCCVCLCVCVSLCVCLSLCAFVRVRGRKVGRGEIAGGRERRTERFIS